MWTDQTVRLNVRSCVVHFVLSLRFSTPSRLNKNVAPAGLRDEFASLIPFAPAGELRALSGTGWLRMLPVDASHLDMLLLAQRHLAVGIYQELPLPIVQQVDRVILQQKSDLLVGTRLVRCRIE